MHNFEFRLPKHLHEKALEAIDHAPGLDHAEKQHGKVRLRSPNGDGVVLELSPVADTDRVIVHVVENPQNIPLEEIETAFRKDMDRFIEALEHPKQAAQQQENPPEAAAAADAE